MGEFVMQFAGLTTLVLLAICCMGERGEYGAGMKKRRAYQSGGGECDDMFIYNEARILETELKDMDVNQRLAYFGFTEQEVKDFATKGNYPVNLTSPPPPI